MIEVLFLAIALAMDAFAVSVGLGSSQDLNQGSSQGSKQSTQPQASLFKMAMLVGLYFGIFQGIMPLIGYLFGKSILGFLASFAPYIACAILLILGGKMLLEAFTENKTETNKTNPTTNNINNHMNHRNMTTLAIATSMDAMGAGFTLNLLAVNAWLACAIIGVVTALLSTIGVYLGKLSGSWLESKAEIFGGLVLISIGLKMVLL